MARDYDDYLGTARADAFGDRVIEDLTQWRAQLQTNGLLSAWQRNFRQYHNEDPAAASDSSDAFQIVGNNGEVLGVRINESRNLITNALNLTYAKPVGLRAVATNSTPEALDAAKIANATLTDDFKAAGGGKTMRNAGEIGLVITTGFVDCEWDLFGGEAYIPDDTSMTYTGKPKMSERFPDEVRFDLTKRRWDDVWSTSVIQRANRFILASQFPEKAEEILNAPSMTDSKLNTLRYSDEHSDDIVVVKYLHRPVNSRLLPSGRFGLVLEDGTVLRDGDNPYSMVAGGKLGIFPITASSGMGSVYGYPIMNDLSPLQQWLNLIASMLATLVAGYGAPNIVGPPLAQMDMQQLVGGGRYFGAPVGADQIKALSLLPDITPLFKLLETISGYGEKLSGMNSVVRGGAEQDMSGKAVALWKSMAVQFMGSFQQSAIEQHEAAGDYNIGMRQKFSSGEQIAEIVGDNNVQRSVKYNAAETFGYISKVRAEAVDPVATTPEGREDRAQFLMSQGAGLTRQEYLTLLETGRDEPMYRAASAQNSLIQQENDELMNGEDPIVLEDDKHELHDEEHGALVAEPNSRRNGKILAVVLNHKAKHKLFMMGVSPMQGVDPQTGQPYPSAVDQLVQARAQQAQQAAMAQQPDQGAPPQTEQPQQQAPAQPQQPAMSMQDQMQQSAMGPAA